MLWFWSALLASVLWGISYANSEYTLKHGMYASSQLALIGLVMTPIYVLIAYKNGTLLSGLSALKTQSKVLGSFMLIMVCYGFANMAIYWAIQHKNATVSSLIEITYPLFVALFSFVIFHDNQLTPGSILGGSLIFAGVCVMYFVK